MIGFWNKREVFVGQSLEKFSRVRQILISNGIKYTHKAMNRKSAGINSGTRRMGTLGQNYMSEYMYYVYVHKNDYELAMELLKAKR